MLSAAPRVGDPLGNEWPNARLLEWDDGTLNDFLPKRGVSDGAIALFRVSLTGGDYDHVSALQTISSECFYAGSPELLTLRGGNDQLPEAFARKLDRRIHYGAAVVKVGQDAHKVRVGFIQSGTQHQMEADRVYVTNPSRASTCSAGADSGVSRGLEARVHFAGEHTSGLGMTLEGAAQSGFRAAMEIAQ